MDIQFEPRSRSAFWFACVDIEVIKDPELSPIDKTVFTVICAHVNTKTRTGSLKVGTIAKEASCSERSVQNSLRALEVRGVLERNTKFKDGRQVANIWRIVGFEAPCYADRGAGDSPQGVQEIHQGGEGDAPRLYENNINEKDSLTGAGKPADRTPTGSGEPAAGEPAPQTPPEEEAAAFDAASQMTPAEFGAMFEAGAQAMAGPTDVEAQPTGRQEERFPVSEAPEVMRSTAEYLLLKTGRSALSEAEISALRTLAARQYPARVQKEIDRAVERYGRQGRPLRGLTFCYIAEALKHQTSRNPHAPASRSAQKTVAHDYGPKFEEEAPMSEADAAYWEAELARLEAEYAKDKGGGES